MTEREKLDGWWIGPDARKGAEAPFRATLVGNSAVSAHIAEGALVVLDGETYYPGGRYVIPLAVINRLRALTYQKPDIADFLTRGEAG